ncbi:MAG: PhoH family protein [Spirochaetia bacterium]|nr:PhoH family protein [Spirochaetia bacterium]
MSETKVRVHLHLERDDVFKLYGIADANLKLIEKATGVILVGKDEKIVVRGEKKACIIAKKVIRALEERVASGGDVSGMLVEELIEDARTGLKTAQNPQSGSVEYGLMVSSQRDFIRPKTANQKNYIKTIFDNQVTFGIGPAGTGKTYLATAAALYYLREKKVERIVLVRPVVEAGESLGFLPGDMKEKTDPYLRPLFDAIYDMIEPRIFHELVENEVIEVAPLAYMRGRTLNKAFVILDEAQNTTIDQMKMFLTRTGNGSKVVVTGDITQIDLPPGRKSGLIHAKEIFEGEAMEGMAFSYFNSSDVSRADIVRRILDAYEKYEKKTGI